MDTDTAPILQPPPAVPGNDGQADDAAAKEKSHQERIQWFRKFTPLFCFVMVPLMTSFRLKEMAEKHDRTGATSVLVSKTILYVPSILYTYSYLVKRMWSILRGCCGQITRGNQMETGEAIGSSALRIITATIGILKVVFETCHIYRCYQDKEHPCSGPVIYERCLVQVFIVGLILFIYKNKYYSQKGLLQLFLLTYFLSATVYCYVLNMFNEEMHIYHKIMELQNTTEEAFLPIRRRYANWTDSSLAQYASEKHTLLGKLFESLLEMIDGAICEVLVVAISITIAKICLVGPDDGDRNDVGNAGHNNGNAGDTTGNTEDNTGNAGDTTGNAEDNTGNAGDTTGNTEDNTGNAGDTTGNAGHNNGNAGDNNGDAGHDNGIVCTSRLKKVKKVCWIVIVPLSCVVLGILIVLNVRHVKPKCWWHRLGFALMHTIVLIVGFLISGVFIKRNQVENLLGMMARTRVNEAPYSRLEPREVPPIEVLDRNMLYFGAAGFFSYAGIGLVHSVYLIFTDNGSEVPLLTAIGSAITDSASIIQGLAQTYVILHRDMVNSEHSYWAGIILWMVNFIMFGLNLFDAATLGIYANPVPKDSNVMWTMLVRGLGPFNVFYRFHSLAIISEIIEHPLH